MDNKINAYKIIGDTPSIYAEVDETLGKFTLTLLKDNETVKTVTNTDCGQTFNVPSPGIYAVSVSYSAEKHYSTEIYFSEEEFKNNKLKSSSPVPEPDMSKTQDPLLDDVDDFLITVKIKKGKKSTLDKLIKGKASFLAWQKVSLIYLRFLKITLFISMSIIHSKPHCLIMMHTKNVSKWKNRKTLFMLL